jgi:hypothetical protein
MGLVKPSEPKPWSPNHRDIHDNPSLTHFALHTNKQALASGISIILVLSSLSSLIPRHYLATATQPLPVDFRHQVAFRRPSCSGSTDNASLR